MILDSEFIDLQLEIARQRLHIEDREALVEVLTQDGHDVSDQETILKEQRSELAVKIARIVALIR
ncbi:hypothetical protein [Bradyrhizobium cosmicum]|uniref:hypothetical protein n=1 Tax=Bradyrhizobium cosmicum TaxID=1404864 RepID=UPI00116382BC|nr:hypothetical protein [Bradyrhizobium cosmicum]QDP23839.1 hypothetical protein FNV92_17510 [Bradyrhizobium cosmicum]